MSSSITLDTSTLFYNGQNYMRCQRQLEQSNNDVIVINYIINVVLCDERHILTMRHKIVLTNDILVCKLKVQSLILNITTTCNVAQYNTERIGSHKERIPVAMATIVWYIFHICSFTLIIFRSPTIT